MRPVISTQALTIGYKLGKIEKTVLSNLNLCLFPGELTTLIGPNGTGKSTLLKTLSGNLKKLSGAIRLNDRDIELFSHQELALFRSIVTTDRQEIDHLTVRDLVTLGRFPYTDWQGNLKIDDLTAIEKSIKFTGLENLQYKELSKLSDGEKQKGFIARALAQSAKVIILDEPTAFLDLPNKFKIIGLLRKIAHEEGTAILISTHDLDLAMMLSDKLWLMNPMSILVGVPEDLVLHGAMANLFGEENFSYGEKGARFAMDYGNKLNARVEGDEPGTFWMSRALERKGYNVNQSIEAEFSIKSIRHNGGYNWGLTRNGLLYTFDTVEHLLNAL